MARQFDLQGQLEGIYARFPEAAPMPVIGITGKYEDLTCKLGTWLLGFRCSGWRRPVIIPPEADRHVIINTLERIDGLILSGGGDFNPPLGWRGAVAPAAWHQQGARYPGTPDHLSGL